MHLHTAVLPRSRTTEHTKKGTCLTHVPFKKSFHYIFIPIAGLSLIFFEVCQAFCHCAAFLLEAPAENASRPVEPDKSSCKKESS